MRRRPVIELLALPLASLVAWSVVGAAPSGAQDLSTQSSAHGHAEIGRDKASLRRFEVTWRRVTSGLTQPTEVTSAPDGRNRLFVVQKGGTVRIVRDGKALRRPYLSIGQRIDPAGEGGLLSLAFSPIVPAGRPALGGLLARIGRRPGRGADEGSRPGGRPGAVEDAAHRAAHRAQPTTTTTTADSWPSGRDGHLYIGVGDGGERRRPRQQRGGQGRPAGKILRINPYGNCRERRYCVPNGNPFVGKRGRDEIWLMGLRNPWRFSFDARTDDLWIGDVGQDAFEEISRVGPNPRRIHLGLVVQGGAQHLQRQPLP